MSKKKSNFRTLAEAVIFERLGNLEISTEHLNVRRMNIEELKDIIREAFGKAKKSADVEAQTPTHGWGDAEIENEINWVERLNLKEFFEAGELAEADACEPEEKEDTEDEE